MGRLLFAYGVVALLMVQLQLLPGAIGQFQVQIDIGGVFGDNDLTDYSAHVNEVETALPTVPPHRMVAKMARYIAHTSNWAAIATTSSHPRFPGVPFTNVISVSDGPVQTSSGVPYMYMSKLDISSEDIVHNSTVSMAMTLAQDDYCKKQKYDPQDPRCARVLFVGNIITLPNNTQEAAFARDALFSRHPDMRDWPSDHGWFFSKLNISSICVLDYFGGIKYVSISDYFKVKW